MDHSTIRGRYRNYEKKRGHIFISKMRNKTQKIATITYLFNIVISFFLCFEHACINNLLIQKALWYRVRYTSKYSLHIMRFLLFTTRLKLLSSLSNTVLLHLNFCVWYQIVFPICANKQKGQNVQTFPVVFQDLNAVRCYFMYYIDKLHTQYGVSKCDSDLPFMNNNALYF